WFPLLQRTGRPRSGHWRVVEGGIVPETECVFQHLSAVLKAPGKSFDDVERAGVFLTSMSNFAAEWHTRKVFQSALSRPHDDRGPRATAWGLRQDRGLTSRLAATRRVISWSTPFKSSMFSVRHRSVVINWRFCLTRPEFRPKACKRLLVNSISAKRPSSCRRTILRTRVECASSHLGWSSTLRDIPRSAQPVPL